MSWIVNSLLQHTWFESEDQLDLRSIREINRVEVYYGDMECVLVTIHQFEQWRYHSHSTLRWSFQCCRHLGVLSLPVVYCPFADQYHMIDWYVVQHEIGIERHDWDVALMEWERGLSSFTSLFVVLPNTSIMLNWFIGAIEEGIWSSTSSMVNWSSNAPFNRIILPSISWNRNINRSNRVLKIFLK